ncbi:RING finger protein 141 [Parasteatoda tepidariorum]|uniref:RING finger protein 141 n=1 Tax=Parasteatoda tepidariorum TaxID=114398 RepID=UPI00077F9B73|nr:RING finger protein 141 [Parasteatoda tepidariorum]
MGQSFTSQLEEIKDDVVKEAHTIKNLLDISHEELLEKLNQVNEILAHAADDGNSRLEFKIKEESDTTFFWKHTIKIVCVRHLTSPPRSLVYKLLNLRQFLTGYKMILYHMNYKQEIENCASAKSENPSGLLKQFSASMILDEITSGENPETEDCIICMERKPEVTLPCTHAYCLFCIEQWNVSNKTCPVCRETVENTDESWVTPDIPNSSEINAEVQKALTELTLNLPEDDD